MAAFLLRRIGYGFLTVLGVLLLLFVLFFAVTDPDDIARKAVGERARPEVYAQWKKNHGYDKPLFLNREFAGSDARRYTDTLLAEHFRRMLTFDFGRSDADDSAISRRLREGAGPSLSLTVPLFVFGLRRRHRPGAVRRLLPRDLHRPRRAGAVHADHERRRPALHHRRPVPRGHAAQVVPDLGLRSRPDGDGAVRRPAGAGRRGERHRRGRALLPHHLHRGDRAATTCARRGPRAAAMPASWSATCCATP